jgi:GNAT superfamily N-acetyltransferase
MADMLVKLYDLPDLYPHLQKLAAMGIEIRRSRPTEAGVTTGWVRKHFSEGWRVETGVALQRRPVGCFIAVEQQPLAAPSEDPYHLPQELLLGFACYDVVAKGMFGPTGVREDCRGRGIGTALLLACLHAMRDEGYAYGIIGWAGPQDFYAKTVGATVIEGSAPGVYRGPLIADVDSASDDDGNIADGEQDTL